MEQRDAETLSGLTREIRALNQAKGWRSVIDTDQGPESGPWFAAYCALATSEISEALEAYRDKVWSDIRRPLRAGETIPKPIGVGPELADALIRILDMADIWGIDLPHELTRVLEYGWTRPYQHGGKTL